jgi:RNA polymerase subunit RPABC4/transcription elongation factor Spt4
MALPAFARPTVFSSLQAYVTACVGDAVATKEVLASTSVGFKADGTEALAIVLFPYVVGAAKLLVLAPSHDVARRVYVDIYGGKNPCQALLWTQGIVPRDAAQIDSWRPMAVVVDDEATLTADRAGVVRRNDVVIVDVSEVAQASIPTHLFSHTITLA